MANAGIDTIYDFSSVIEPKVRLTNVGEKIRFETTDSQNLVYVDMYVPKKYLDFPLEEIGFLDFPDFYNNISLIKDPEFKYGKDESKMEDWLEIKGKNAKSKYLLSDPSTIKRIGEGAIPERNIEYEMVLSKEDINEINKIFVTTKTKDLKITVKSTGVVFNFTGDGLYTEHTFVRKHTQPYTGEEFFVESNSVVFSKIPKRNYKAKFDKSNLIELELIPSENDDKDITAILVI